MLGTHTAYVSSVMAEKPSVLHHQPISWRGFSTITDDALKRKAMNFTEILP